ncbi:MarR family winged helix-turn-helix transcriptional regulator [Marinobacter sp. F3R08]|uniref:MarR family winged helix-turn-helix transcriptional regulator n=1 Tax=Marinobacter sp. F3R08 TaxID=2841559 RepID=UPI001C08EC0F|nr:MarR family transcriptional regulator [Marinobacter sp. F3R08]MBU2955881.1 MarR family transcriptional regulator [Marinobacter sp. F3R08]
MSKSKSTTTAKQTNEDRLSILAERPGFLIRRLHQIHVALFHEECAVFGLTPVQYSAISALEGLELDQKQLGQKVGIDRASTTDVLRRIEKAGWIERRKCPEDGRRQLARLTPRGEELLSQVTESALRAHDRTLEPLTKAERMRFIRYMSKIVSANNDHGRASLKLS